MKAPKLLKNESTASFRTRVAMWEKRTGKKYPKSGWGTREERALSNRIKLGDFGQSNQLDYSKDYNLDDQAKEESLAGGYVKYRDSKEGKEFARQQLAIQEAEDQDKKEDFAYKASKGLNIDTSQVDNAVDVLNKLKGENKQKLSIPQESVKEVQKVEETVTSKVSATKEPWTGEVGKRTLTNPTSIQKKLRKAGFKDEQLVKLMIKHRDWKAARR